MGKLKKINKKANVPTLGEVAPSNANQKLSGDLVAASIARQGSGESKAPDQEVAFDKVRELLMGETMQSLRDDLNTSHRIILQRVDALGSAANSQLETLEGKVDSLSTEMTAEVAARKSFADSHQRSMQISAAELERELADFKASANSSMDKIAEDFEQQASFHGKAVENFEKAMSAQLEEKGNDLGETTVAKDKLATLLFDAAAAFADPEAAA